jgi:hypothetical protein
LKTVDMDEKCVGTQGTLITSGQRSVVRAWDRVSEFDCGNFSLGGNPRTEGIIIRMGLWRFRAAAAAAAAMVRFIQDGGHLAIFFTIISR